MLEGYKIYIFHGENRKEYSPRTLKTDHPKKSFGT